MSFQGAKPVWHVSGSTGLGESNVMSVQQWHGWNDVSSGWDMVEQLKNWRHDNIETRHTLPDRIQCRTDDVHHGTY